jgi:hypothetical protein
VVGEVVHLETWHIELMSRWLDTEVELWEGVVLEVGRVQAVQPVEVGCGVDMVTGGPGHKMSICPIVIEERKDIRVLRNHVGEKIVRNGGDVRVRIGVLLSGMGEGVVGHIDEEV